MPSDHAAVHQFLTTVFQGPSRQEYKSSLDDPFYEPHDRLLARHDSKIVGHVHLTHRVMRFGSASIPVAGLHWLGTLAEYRFRGLGRRLLDAAEKRMAGQGALVGLLSTAIPHFFRPAGWALCGRRSRSQAGVRDVLGALSARGLHHRQRRRRLSIRPWRRMERDALVRIYGQNLDGQFGLFQRSTAYWDWLINRGAYDQIHVALDGLDLLELEEAAAPVVGYSVTRGDQIIELVTAPDEPKADVQLLARACGDAIERGRHSITFHGSPRDRLHKLFRIAGGTTDYSEADGPRVLMARILAPVELFRALAGEFARRAEAADLPHPIELGLLVDGRKYGLSITPEGVVEIAPRIGRSYLALNVADFTRLVLGHLDWRRALRDGRVRASTKIALKVGRVLFPRLPAWRPPLDDLQAGK
jgi:predicted N-acetyltransferase YhbS